ncbi:HAMP domain-containing sensor histidine kinase [Gemmatimonas sp.]|uniref:sensor histidine kinase n=1 Tax=Gemmatimonas sp. TaxID=1962908 RepID=UPI002ED7DA8E
MPHPRPLRHHLLQAFAGLATAISLLAALLAFALAYQVEDDVIESSMRADAKAVELAYRTTGQWTSALPSHLRVVRTDAEWPRDIAALAREEPGRTEYPGTAGRYYHARRMVSEFGDRTARPDSAWLLAEVGDRLALRPMRVRLWVMIAAAWALTLCAALLVARRLAHSIGEPLDQLAQQVSAWSPGQPVPPLVGPWPHAEVGDLARRLTHSMQHIQGLLAREREFVSGASHELRTPISVVRSASDLLMRDTALPAGALEHVHRVHMASMQLEETTAALLALARENEAGSEAGEVPLVPLLEQIVVRESMARSGQASPDLTVTVDIPDHTTVVARVAVLQIVLRNLLGNAMRHTLSGQIAVHRDADWLVVRNDGVIAAGADKPLAAPLVVRADHEGMGFGLTLVHRLCARHEHPLVITRGPDWFEARVRLFHLS